MFDMRECAIPGCYEIAPRVVDDSRGRFVKVFAKEEFARHGLDTQFSEEYYSVSKRGVIRGMHFQVPPFDHSKIVYCVHGEVFDVVVDLRVGSPTFREACTFNLSATKGNFVYIPPGLAHGFCVENDTATLIYMVSSAHSPAHDTGVHWSSIGLDWPVCNPILSSRDDSFVSLRDFQSPFLYVRR